MNFDKLLATWERRIAKKLLLSIFNQVDLVKGSNFEAVDGLRAGRATFRTLS